MNIEELEGKTIDEVRTFRNGIVLIMQDGSAYMTMIIGGRESIVEIAEEGSDASQLIQQIGDEDGTRENCDAV